MLLLCGILRAATTLGGGTNKKTGEIIKFRRHEYRARPHASLAAAGLRFFMPFDQVQT